MDRLVYVIGEPGCGKSSTLRRATEIRWPGVTASEDDSGLIPVMIHSVDSEPVAVEAGRRRVAFGGTDALSMGVMPKAKQWLAEPAVCGLRLAEGDRLSTTAFFGLASELGFQLTVVWLDAPPEVLRARREARGSHQNETWLKGRCSKVHRLAAEFAAVTVRLDATQPPGMVADDLAALL